MDDNELFGISEQLNDTISRAAAINAICEDGTQLERQGQYTMTMAERKQRDADILGELPSAQPEIIHCKDCDSAECSGVMIYCLTHGCYMRDNDFCNYGERKDGDHHEG